MNQDDTYNIRMGIMGAGRLGSFHADKALEHPEVDFVAVYDPVEENRRRIARKALVVPYERPAPFFDAIDAVVIAAPSTEHFNLGRMALEQGCHVLMEKPLTTSAQDAQTLIDLAEENYRVFQSGHVEQYNPGWLAALDLLDDVRGGSPCFIQAKRTSGYTFRCVDIGVVLDLMIHDLELILSLVPSEVESVDAFGFPVTGGFEDTAFASLVFANGTRAVLYSSRTASESAREMTVYSSLHTVTIDFHQRTAACFAPDESVRSGRFGPNQIQRGEIPKLLPTFMKDHFTTDVRTGEPIDALSLEMDNFVSAILRGTPSRVPAWRAGKAVKIAELIIDRLGKR